MDLDISVNYAFLCDDVRSEIGGKFSYIGQTEVVFSPVLPFVVPKAFIVYSCSGPVGKYNVSTKVTNIDSGQVIFSIPDHMIEIKKINQSIREVYALHNLQYKEEGKYLVEVLYDNEEILNFSYLVKKITQERVTELPINLSSN